MPLNEPPASRRAKPALSDADRKLRRDAILVVALDLFSRQGFGATRLEDVARAAGLAKGTLYLYFPHKQALFEAIVKDMITPVIADVASLLPRFEGTTRELFAFIAEMLISRILEGPASGILRLMIAEGPRFPELAAFHHREVVSRGIEIMRVVMERGMARGEIASDAALRFPQMMFAPAVTAIVWNSLFAHLSPLDTRAFILASIDVLLRGLEERAP